MRELVGVGVGGLLGAVSRYLVGRWLADAWAVPGHLATLAVNCAGSLVLGLTASLGQPTRGQLFAVVGFCGSFTTYSSWLSDISSLARGVSLQSAVSHTLVSMALGLAAFGL